MLRKLITKEEYSAMDTYRQSYIFKGDNFNLSNIIPIEEILEEWSVQKENLSKLLGGKLILSREINYAPSEEELKRELLNLTSCNNSITYGREKHSSSEFVSSFRKLMPYKYQSLLTAETLAANAWTKETPLIIELPNGKTFKVIKGTKPLKVLGKLAAAYNIPGFEEFRICHSLIFNDKSLNGTLSLSIHPFDYWTMSDNNYNWESCMNWRNSGCYRQGTVEMMNSPIVIIAYLSSQSPFFPNNDNDFSWNNKKWRQLFIVNKDIICGIKGYSYQNNYLTQLIINWLADLAKENLGWSYTPDTYYYHNFKLYQNETEITNSNIYFSTNYMYNDFDNLPKHYCRLGSEADITNLAINYSGAPECMCCGNVSDPDFKNEESLACQICDEPAFFCSCCGETFYNENERYILNEEDYCENCYNENTFTCSYCDNLCRNEDECYLDILLSEETISPQSLSLCPDCFEDLKAEVPVYQGYNQYYVYFNDIPKHLLPYQLRGKTAEQLIQSNFYGKLITPPELTRIN